MRRTYPLIAGGGPAGAATAILLARSGLKPLVIERSREPHDIVCGGFLGIDATRLLNGLGLDAFLLGAHPIGRLRVIAGDRTIETVLPFPAAGLSRRTLDAALLAQAEAAGAEISRGATIRLIDRHRGRIDLADGASLDSESLFLATGKHDVRGVARPTAAAGRDPSLGLRIALGASAKLAQMLAGTIELHLFRHGYAGLLLQEDGSANLCLSVAQSRLKLADGDPARLIAMLAREAPRLAERYDAAGNIGAWSSVARIPYGWRESATSPGLFRLGDQAAVIASLAGDGVAIALASARLAATAFIDGGPGASLRYQQAFRRRAFLPVGLAGLIRRIGESPLMAGPALALLRHSPPLLRLAATATRIGGG